MISQLTLTDTDFQRPVAGNNPAHSTDHAESDSSGAFAAIFAPLAAQGESGSADGSADASSSGLGESGGEQALLAPVGERSGEAALLPAANEQVMSPLAEGGNSGKILPPGGNTGQPVDAAASAAAMGDPGVAFTASGADGATALENADASASSGEALAGIAVEAGLERSAAIDGSDPQAAASAGAARAAAGVAGSAAETASADKTDGSRPLREASATDQPGGGAGLLGDRREMTDAPGAHRESAAPSRGGEVVNALMQAGSGLSDDSAVPQERGQGAALAELRIGERPLIERSVAELTTNERTPRLALQQVAGQAGWGEEIQGRLQWLSRQGLQRAELQLHPAELGSIDVRLTSENDQTSVVFLAANRSARELLEAEIPRLRELFSQAGVELGQVEVSDRPADGSRQFATRDESRDKGHTSTVKTDTGNDDTEVGESILPATGADSGRGMIDYYI